MGILTLFFCQKEVYWFFFLKDWVSDWFLLKKTFHNKLIDDKSENNNLDEKSWDKFISKTQEKVFVMYVAKKREKM